MSLKIGFTEAGDGGRDLSWLPKCLSRKVDGAVIVTKTLTDKCINAVMECHKNSFPIIVHATTTGWGGTLIEPGVWHFTVQLNQIAKLIDAGFPIQNVILRIDPIWPTDNGLTRVKQVIERSIFMGILPAARIRISVLDEYRHVKERIRKAGFEPIYGPDRFQPSPEEFAAVEKTLSEYDLTYHTCAEPFLTSEKFCHTGCLSELDLQLMGLSYDKTFKNPQNRHGCECLGCKTELLSCKHPCASECIYCYWKN